MDVPLAIVIVSLSFFGEALFGFGGGLVSIPLLSLFLGVKTSVTLVLFFQLFMGVAAFSSRKSINWSVVRPALLTLVLGVGLGTLSLAVLDDVILNLVLALVIFLYLFKQLFFANLSLRSASSTAVAGGAGFIGGWLQGAVGAGGPAFIIYLSELGLSREAFRASILMLFFVCNMLRMGLSLSNGLFEVGVLWMVLYCLPTFALAMFAGQRIQAKISEIMYRRVVYAVLLVSGCSLIYRFAQAG